jgi:hypothetical protein
MLSLRHRRLVERSVMMKFRPNVAVLASGIFSAYSGCCTEPFLTKQKAFGDNGTVRCLIKRLGRMQLCRLDDIYSSSLATASMSWAAGTERPLRAPA